MIGSGLHFFHIGSVRSVGVSFQIRIIAGTALWNTYRARKVEREHPPRGQFVTIDGNRLHDLEKGGGGH
jgi:hypothetical protein